MNQDHPSHIDAAIADLEGWLERISTAIATLKYFRSEGGSLPAMTQSAGLRASANEDILHDTFFKMTIPDAAEKDLRLAKKTKRTSDIAASLLKGGLKSASKNFPSMVKTVLARDARFVRVNKEWGLTEWYPGMRRGRAAADPSDSNDGSEPALVKKATKGKSMQVEQGTKPLKERIRSLLNSRPNEMFDPKKVAEALQNGDHVPSVTTGLCNLVNNGLIARPQKGQYQSLKRQAIA
jgi:hypothetical protein